MRKILLFIVICTFSLFVGCSKQTQDVKTSANEVSGTQPFEKISKGEIYFQCNSQNLEEISRGIMESYFNEFKKDNVSKQVKITDYTIDKISSIEGDINKFIFYVVYSLKPADMNLYVLAGNGEVKDNWIITRSYFADVKKVDNKYILTNLGTGK
jgi:hypothetical protein